METIRGNTIPRIDYQDMSFYWNILKSDVESQNLASIKIHCLWKDTEISFEHIQPKAKTLLILYPRTWNSITGIKSAPPDFRRPCTLEVFHWWFVSHRVNDAPLHIAQAGGRDTEWNIYRICHCTGAQRVSKSVIIASGCCWPPP